MILRTLTAAALALGGTNPAVAGTWCDMALKTVPQFSACAEAPGGIAVAATQAEADKLASLTAEAEARFASFFGAAPPRYAIGYTAMGADLEPLKAVGFTIAMPWLTDAAFRRSLDESIERAFVVQAERLNLDAGTAEAALAAALNDQKAKFDQQAAARDGALQHEIGHQWYSELFWPGSRRDPRERGHYGGPGPDWLDETAALLMEPGAMADTRRDSFEKIYLGKPDTPTLQASTVAELVDLTHFLSQAHPVPKDQIKLLPTSGKVKEGMQIVTLSSVEAAQLGLNKAALFYFQGRMFADFLVERTGKPAVFARISAAFARNETMDQWLAAEGKDWGLPASVAALDGEWRQWLMKRFGPAAA